MTKKLFPIAFGLVAVLSANCTTEEELRKKEQEQMHKDLAACDLSTFAREKVISPSVYIPKITHNDVTYTVFFYYAAGYTINSEDLLFTDTKEDLVVDPVLHIRILEQHRHAIPSQHGGLYDIIQDFEITAPFNLRTCSYESISVKQGRTDTNISISPAHVYYTLSPSNSAEDAFIPFVHSCTIPQKKNVAKDVYSIVERKVRLNYASKEQLVATIKKEDIPIIVDLLPAVLQVQEGSLYPYSVYSIFN